ncbi:hypothetical protein GPJ56_004505 [Histomonas meleagridis]|uniref:uncharacterized protein n=1 Tax=Histomonas meleagridis TaxID=135588 RepID=UPI0035597E12|nr:hypothetical protein GPJ56_004505 [Histomonas meleagridis]KAH0803605.1 hypothetical protein GO595_003570 [Histomonas meleagridis]
MYIYFTQFRRNDPPIGGPYIWTKEKKIAFVSSYYYFSGKKQRNPLSVYQDCFRYLVGNLTDDVDFYFYTNNESYHILQPPTKANLYVNFTYESPYDICNLRRYEKDYDYIASIHKPGYLLTGFLGAVWNSKICLLDDIRRKGIYKYLFWVDAGLVKKSNYSWAQIPAIERVDYLFSKHKKLLFTLRPRSRVLIRPVKYIPMEKLYITPFDVVIANFFGGPVETIEYTMDLFFKYHDFYLKQKQNILREEFIYSALLLYHPDKYMGIHSITKKCWYPGPGIFLISNNNRCRFPNALHTIGVRNHMFVLIAEKLDYWM